jgi:hypothetical protein
MIQIQKKLLVGGCVTRFLDCLTGVLENSALELGQFGLRTDHDQFRLLGLKPQVQEATASAAMREEICSISRFLTRCFIVHF